MGKPHRFVDGLPAKQSAEYVEVSPRDKRDVMRLLSYANNKRGALTAAEGAQITGRAVKYMRESELYKRFFHFSDSYGTTYMLPLMGAPEADKILKTPRKGAESGRGKGKGKGKGSEG